MRISLATAIACVLLSAGTLASAQSASSSMQGASPAAQQLVMLREGTQVRFKLLDALNSKVTKTGDRFNLEVAEDVRVDGMVAVPVGTRAVGEVTNVVKKGAFGKSGKLDTQLRYLQLGDQRVRLDGKAHDAGAGGTAATVGVAIAAGIFSAFVTGKSADMPIGTEMAGYIGENIQVAARSSAVVATVPVAANASGVAAATVTTNR